LALLEKRRQEDGAIWKLPGLLVTARWTPVPTLWRDGKGEGGAGAPCRSSDQNWMLLDFGRHGRQNAESGATKKRKDTDNFFVTV
jgi:hypothetical protein